MTASLCLCRPRIFVYFHSNDSEPITHTVPVLCTSVLCTGSMPSVLCAMHLCAMYSVLCAMHLCAMYSVLCAMHLCAMYSVLCAMHLCAMCSVLCAMYSVLCAMHQCSMHKKNQFYGPVWEVENFR